MARAAEPSVRLICLGLLVSSAPALAQVPAPTAVARAQEEGTLVEISVGATRTDNVRRMPTDEVEDTVASAGVVLNGARDGTRLDFNVIADLEWYEYLENTYDGELFGVADASLIGSIVPERFTWTVRESFNNSRADAFSAATPDNIESYTYFSTGPRIMLPLGSEQTRLEISGNYSNVAASSDAAVPTSDFDNERYAGTATLVRQINRGTSAALVLNTQRVEFDDTAINTDYDRHEAFVNYSLQGARTKVSADLGATRIEQEDSGSSSGLLARIGGTRQISASSTVSLHLTRQTADSADVFRYNFESERPQSSPLQLATGDPFVETSVNAGWQFSRARTSLSVLGFVTRERYETFNALDRTVRGLSAGVTRRMRPTLTLDIAGRYQRETFDLVNFTDSEYDGSVGLGWQAGRMLNVSLRYQYFKRDGGGIGDSYTENRIGLIFVIPVIGGTR